MKRSIQILLGVVVTAMLLSSCRYNSAAMKEGAKSHYNKGTEYYEAGQYKKADSEFKVARNLLERDVRINEKLNQNAPEARTEIASAKTNKETIANRGKRRSRPQYVIGVEDVLSIFVWQNEDLSKDVVVRPDGRISFPLIDDIEVEGMTLPDLDQAMTARLKEYIRYPEVSISVRRLGGKRVIVLGEVQYPGVYQVTGTESVLEAIAMAQGFTQDSLASSVVVVKGIHSDQPRVIRASANMALKGMGSQNILLDSGDVIFVPKKPISDLVWLTDQLQSMLGPILGDWALIKPLVFMNNAND